MLPLLNALLRSARFLLQPEDQTSGARVNARLDAPASSTLAGLAKAGLWAGLAILAGVALAQLH